MSEEKWNNTLNEHELESRKWYHRRGMAKTTLYYALCYGIILLIAVLFGDNELATRIEKASDVLTWIFIGLMSIPIAYFGGNVVADLSAKKTN